MATRILFYFVTLTTGLCSLAYQTVWQRYLGLMVGSEAKSSAMIVAIFLMGLSIGYLLFGKICEQHETRKSLLRFYGYIELVTGIYALLFNKIFTILFESDLLNGAGFTTHFFLVLILCLPPTILMGATVPIMTTVLPENEKEVNQIHSKIYGVNTLGAFLGVVLCGFVAIPMYGLKPTLYFFAILNILASIPYLLNLLEGKIKEKEKINIIPHSYKDPYLYLYTFVVGIFTISLEIIWIRLVGLSIGSSSFVFPIVLGIFILALGLGSLTMGTSSEVNFKKTILLAILLSLIPTIFAPYLPLALSNLRMMITNHEASFWLYHTIVIVILIILLFPGLFFLGRLLPHTFNLIEKNESDYGKKCGIIYFLNTVGTFIGSLVFAYLAFYFFNMPKILSFLYLLLGSCSLYFLWDKKSYSKPVLIVIGIIFFLVLPWPRTWHTYGLFRTRDYDDRIHLKNIFSTTLEYKEIDEVVRRDIADGPNTTVAAINLKTSNNVDFKSLYVNGKSDSSTVGDYSTLILSGLVPYIHTPHNNLTAAVVGIGTGVTAGVISKSPRVDRTDVVEISSEVVEHMDFFEPENYSFHKNPTVNIAIQDAFSFFRGVENKYDYITSEPTNPWVVGVENLFTSYFYQLIHKSLKPNGVLAQWIQVYSSSNEIILTTIKNLRTVFQFVEVYVVHSGDILLIASDREPDKFHISDEDKKMFDPLLEKMHLQNISEIALLKLLNHKEVQFVIDNSETFKHEIFEPRMSVVAYRQFFTGENADINTLLDPFYARLFHEEDALQSRANILKAIEKDGRCRRKSMMMQDFCKLFFKNFISQKNLLVSGDLGQKIFAYSYLRKLKLLPEDKQLLSKIENQFFLDKNFNIKLAEKLLDEYLKDINFKDAESFLLKLQAAKMPENLLKVLRLRVQRHFENIKKVKSRYF